MIIGSAAIALRTNRVVTSDIDLIMSPDDAKEFLSKVARSAKPNKHGRYCFKFAGWKFDLETTETLHNKSAEILLGRPITKKVNLLGIDHRFPVADFDALFAIKDSHMIYPFKQKKHMKTYKKLLATVGGWRRDAKLNIDRVDIDQELRDMSKLRRKEVVKRFPDLASKVSLSMTNHDFFEQSESAVGRMFHHDDLHQIVAYYDEPMFTRIKRDQSKARCEWDLFRDLPHGDKIKTIREEAMALALERVVIPRLAKEQPIRGDVAISIIMNRLMTHMSSGWFREYAIAHYEQIIDVDIDYIDRLMQKLGGQ
jgi:hypothetical protein